MFIRMLRLPEAIRDRYYRSSLKQAIHAAAPCPVDVKRAMIAWGDPFCSNTYSSTELAGMTMIDSEEWQRNVVGGTRRLDWLGPYLRRRWGPARR
jgi:long-chain acyl-CoA synthetase